MPYTSVMRLLVASIFLLLPLSADAARLYLEPADMRYGVGDTFIANVRLDTEGECVNAARVVLTYPKESVKAVDFSRGGSILTLWVEEPKIDTGLGTVVFSGGIPGGYCGRIPGDAAVTNILGKIVFTVQDASKRQAVLSIDPSSQLLLNDGEGTEIEFGASPSTVTLTDERQTSGNEWVDAVRDDDVPPDPFTIIVESARGVFGGRYFIVFATVDKQSGMDHYEIYERGAWKTITSPYELKDQSLKSLQVKAIDKAGNERMGEYIEGSAPPRVRPAYGLFSVIGLMSVLVVLFIVKRVLDRRRDKYALRR